MGEQATSESGLAPAAPPERVLPPPCPGCVHAGPSRSFKALGTQVTVWPDLDLEPWFRALERTLSRFKPDSDLSRLNRASGRLQVVSPLLYDAVSAALRAAAATDGAFDPTILPALESAGYSRSFERGPGAVGPPVPAGQWHRVCLVPALRAVILPAGVRLDLGGIGKGLAADGALRLLRSVPRALVDAGGDIALRTGPGDPPAEVEVESPFDPTRMLGVLRLRSGAVATSSTRGRAWGPGLHHLIDPRSGRPAESELVAATVVARTAAQADVLAKVCIIRGADAAFPLLGGLAASALLVTRRGDLILTPGMEEIFHVEPSRHCTEAAGRDPGRGGRPRPPCPGADPHR